MLPLKILRSQLRARFVVRPDGIPSAGPPPSAAGFSVLLLQGGTAGDTMLPTFLDAMADERTNRDPLVVDTQCIAPFAPSGKKPGFNARARTSPDIILGLQLFKVQCKVENVEVKISLLPGGCLPGSKQHPTRG
jgi:hypothetical protein